MATKHILLAIAGAALLGAILSTSALGQPHGSKDHPMSSTLGRTHTPTPPATRGYPHGTVNPTWNEFRHNAPTVRVNPHRYGSSVLPTPNRWRGDVNRFDRHRWSRGEWRHERRDGRLGWWWVIGPNWYYYNAPIYPYPDSYFPPDYDSGWWYWCEAYQEYYPYVTYCPGGWERVLPRD